MNLQFVGLDTQYVCADGVTRRRVHLDSAASPLASQVAVDAINELLPHYSNIHSVAHSSAAISTKAFAWAQATIQKCLGFDQLDYTTVFLGSGTTAAINRIARGLSANSDKQQILVSSMEHHANDLPHRSNAEIIYFPLVGQGPNQGEIDLEALETLLEGQAQDISYIAFSAVSNVTGVKNDVAAICKLAKQYGILSVVDAAQQAPHYPLAFDFNDCPDFYIFSGHKLYSPFSPGVMLARNEVLNELAVDELGGGIVEDVSYHDFVLLENLDDREHAGTPNIIGAYALAKVMSAFNSYGLDTLAHQEQALMQELLTGLESIEGVRIYGPTNGLSQRSGCVSFNIDGIEHGLLAAILNDYFSIAVRHGCFCAHPFVSSLLKMELWEMDLSEVSEQQQQMVINSRRGMVRVSIAAYTNSEDIRLLIAALREVQEDSVSSRKLMDQYSMQEDGSFVHDSFAFDVKQSPVPVT